MELGLPSDFITWRFLMNDQEIIKFAKQIINKVGGWNYETFGNIFMASKSQHDWNKNGNIDKIFIHNPIVINPYNLFIYSFQTVTKTFGNHL